MVPNTEQTSQSTDKAALIVGCGYLGRVLAQRLIESGHRVYGTTRNESYAQRLASLGVRPMLLHVTQPVTFASLTPAMNEKSLDVYYLIPPGRVEGSPTSRQVVLGGIAHMVKALKRANVRRAILASSSAVYGQMNGQRVDADTPPQPNNERAELLLHGESLWLEAGDRYSVLRLAGLYGPGRIIGMRAVREGSPIVGDPHAILNLIHVDDAATLLMAMVASDTAGRIELGSDGHPVPRVEYYRYLASKLGVPSPQVIDNPTASTVLGLNAERLSRSSNKALDNALTCRRTRWVPVYSNYRLGLDTILARMSHARPQTTGQTC